LHAATQQVDVEDVAAIGGLVFGQQVKQQGRAPTLDQPLRNGNIPPAVPTTAAAVREDDNATRGLGHRQSAREIEAADPY
jgi:hypothetical protein